MVVPLELTFHFTKTHIHPGKVCSDYYATPLPSPNGSKIERPNVGLKGTKEGVKGDKVGELGL